MEKYSNILPKINLQPKYVAPPEKVKVKIPIWPIIPIILVAVGLIAFNNILQKRITKQQAELRKLDFALKDYKKIIEDYESSLEERKYLMDKINFVKGVSKSQELWVNFLDELARKIPTDVWIDSLEAEKEGKYRLTGTTYSYSAVGNFMLYLNSISSIKKVILTNVSKKSKEAAATAMCSFKIEGDMQLGETPKETATSPFSINR